MKMILAIVSHDDSSDVISGLTESGFMVTKIATIGGFLKKDNTTIILGVDDEKVDSAIKIIYNKSHSRKQMVPVPVVMEHGLAYTSEGLIDVTVGGATIFVLGVERFEKM